MTELRKIPNALMADVAGVMSEHHTHAEIDMIFARAGAPGDPPVGNKIVKVQAWLRTANDEPTCDPFAVLGAVLEELMDRDVSLETTYGQFIAKRRERIGRALQKHGLSYSFGGKILGATLSAPTRSLDDLIRLRNLGELQKEFERARANVETDPGAAITAACAIVETTCKVIIADEGLALPSDLSVLPLWKAVQAHLTLDPSKLHDQHLKQMLGGLASTIHGIAGLRSNAGSAHGQGPGASQPEPRHARLAVHSAHTLVVFVLESWKP